MLILMCLNGRGGSCCSSYNFNDSVIALRNHISCICGTSCTLKQGHEALASVTRGTSLQRNYLGLSLKCAHLRKSRE